MAEVRTNRLLWRPPGPDDLDGLHDLVSDLEVVKWTATWPFPADRGFTRSRCKPVDPAKGQVGLALLDDQVIGTFGVLEGDIGYMFRRDQWGQGYATEIGHAVVSFAFTNYDWPELKACVFTKNDGSARVLEKLGFTRVGTCTSACVAQGAELATIDYALSRDDWLAADPRTRDARRMQKRSTGGANSALRQVLVRLGFVQAKPKPHKSALRVEPDPLILYRLGRNRLKADG